MNYFMIFTSIFFFGVSAGLILSHIIANRDGNRNPRLKDWKNQF